MWIFFTGLLLGLIIGLGLGVIAGYVSKKTMQECVSTDELCKEILDGIRLAASGWGIKIMKVLITDLAPVQSFRIIGDKGKTIIPTNVLP